MSSENRAHDLADLAWQLLAVTDDGATAEAVIGRILDLIPDADWASITIRRRGNEFVTLAATHPDSMRADELQYALHEGPCVDAASGAGWCRSDSVGDDQRWPRWGPRAAELGVGSLLAVQLGAEDAPIGALNMYATTTDRFNDRDEVDFALLAGIHIAIALTSARQIHGLETAIASRHVIGLAQGRLMERYGLSVDRSFDLLRRYSNTANIRLADVARSIVDTGNAPAAGARDALVPMDDIVE